MPISKHRLAELANRDEAMIDYTDIPELDNAFWTEASLSAPKPRPSMSKTEVKKTLPK